MTAQDEAWRREAVFDNYAERPFAAPPENIRIWSYAQELSHAPGEVLRLSVSTNARHYAVEIIRDGLKPERMFHREGIAGRWHDTPQDCSVTGCGWPVSLEISIPRDWPSGGYIIRTTAAEKGRGTDSHDHLVLIARAKAKAARAACCSSPPPPPGRPIMIGAVPTIIRAIAARRETVSPPSSACCGPSRRASSACRPMRRAPCWRKIRP